MKQFERFIKQLDLPWDVREVVERTIEEEERNISYTRPPSILRDLEQVVRDVVNRGDEGSR